MERFDELVKDKKPCRVKNFKRRNLMKYFNELGFKNGVEIGVRTGKFSEVMCQEIKGLKLLSVDPYSLPYEDVRSKRIGEARQDKFYNEAKKRLSPYNCDLIREESLITVQKIPYESLDFVYIDGSHQFDYVMCDIIEWAKRVKKGGIVSGHDYFRFRDADVVEAVDIYRKVHKISKLFITDERTPSWWFIKK